jgi:hypothetical protein
MQLARATVLIEMMRRRVLVAPLLLGLWLLASALQSLPNDLDVRAQSGVVTIRAHAAPLSEVLDRLSRASGFKLVYEGPRPSLLVTTSLQELPEAEGVRRLLEGLGLNYALQTDTAGRRVVVLIVSGSVAPTPSPARAGSASANASFVRPPDVDEPAPLGMPDADVSDDSNVEPGFPPGSVFERPPGMEGAGQGAGAGASPGAGPGPGHSGFGAPSPSALPDRGLPAPSFPGQASLPAPPYFPPEASNPPPG